MRIKANKSQIVFEGGFKKKQYGIYMLTQGSKKFQNIAEEVGRIECKECQIVRYLLNFYRKIERNWFHYHYLKPRQDLFGEET